MKNKVKCLRQQRGMSQQELADLIGVSRQTLSSLENGRYNPSVITSYKIVKVLEIEHIEDLFFLEEEVSVGLKKNEPLPDKDEHKHENMNINPTG